MKRICIVTTISGTLTSFVVELAQFLVENEDLDITLICDNDPEFGSSLPPSLHYIPVSMKRGISFGGLRTVLQLRKIFQREKFDLVQYSTPNASLYASLAAWLAKVPVRLYCQWGMVYVAFKGWKRKFFRWEEKLVCRLSNVIEPDSKGNLDFAHNEGLYPEGEGHVIWNGSAKGVDLKKFDFARKEEFRRNILNLHPILQGKTVVGFVGRLDRDKGCNELLTAFRNLRRLHSDLVLLFIGNMDKPQTIIPELYEYLRNTPEIVCTGAVNNVEEYLATMDIFVLPSYREGFGMAVVEAEAMGVPVAVTQIPGPLDGMLPEETGLTYPAHNANALEEVLEKLIKAPEERERLGRNGVEFVRAKFDAKVFAEKVLADRRQLLGLVKECIPKSQL